MRRPRDLVALLAVAACSLGWLDPSATPRAAARLYADGKFDDAATKYNQALTDAPDSGLLHFNLGDAEYRRGKFDAALRAFQQVPQDAPAEYNQGNALYQLGTAAEQEKPQDALSKWAEALVAYRRAIASDPADQDAKFNYEWVSRKIDELKKKLEEQQQQQQDQQQQQNQQNQQQQNPDDKSQQQQDQQQQKQQASQDQQQEQKPQDEQKQEGKAPEDQQEQQAKEPSQPSNDGQPQPAQAAGGTAQPAEGELSRDEATALLDGERNEELRPDEVIRRQLGTGEAAVQDW